MGKTPPVVVYRRGFGSSLVLGLFGTICVMVVCATGVAIFGAKLVNDRLDSLIDISPEAIAALADWQEALPPSLGDALNDRRMPSYRENLQVTATLARDWKTERLTPIVEISNTGDEVVSLMSLRLQVEDDEQMPLEEMTVYAATPITLENEWRGPLLPGSKRRFKARGVRADAYGDLHVTWEICELRVWQPSESAAEAEILPALELTADTLDDDPATAMESAETDSGSETGLELENE